MKWKKIIRKKPDEHKKSGKNSTRFHENSLINLIGIAIYITGSALSRADMKGGDIAFLRGLLVVVDVVKGIWPQKVFVSYPLWNNNNILSPTPVPLCYLHLDMVGVVLKKMWNIFVSPSKMHRSRTNGDVVKGQPANQGTVHLLTQVRYTWKDDH